MRIKIDTDRCIGAAQCVLTAPEVFVQDEEGISTLRSERAGSEEEQEAREAADVCPVRAIDIVD